MNLLDNPLLYRAYKAVYVEQGACCSSSQARLLLVLLSSCLHFSTILFLSTLLVVVLNMTMLVSSATAQEVAPSADCPKGLPFLGIGLGYNQYDLEQVNGLAGGDLCKQPLVYNWTLGDSPQTANNSPHLDFSTRYVPMMWGCGSAGPELVRRFLETQNYSGPLLVFNEPDRADQANCAPERAASLLNELHHMRVIYEVETGNALQFYVGGTARSDSGIAWMNQFRAAYIEAYGTDPFGQDGTPNPVAQGVHFHLYPRYAYPDGVGSFADVSEQFAEWDLWLTQNNLRAWVTEVGVLHAPYQPLPKEEYIYLLEHVLPLLFWNERIDHAFIFTLNAISGTDSEEFAKSALIEDGVETAAYQFVQNICSQAGSGYCTPEAKRAIMAAQQVADVATESVTESAESTTKAEAEAEPVAEVGNPPTLGRKSSYTRPNAESYRRGYKLKTEN